MTCLLSLPLDLLTSISSSKFDYAVCWLEHDRHYLGDDTQNLSNFQFERTFLEDWKCLCNFKSIHPPSFHHWLAFSCKGRMSKLGSAEMFVNRKECVTSSINVPINSCHWAPTIVPPSPRRFKGTKQKIAKPPMVKLKGETLKCGVDQSATLCVLVHISYVTDSRIIKEQLCMISVLLQKSMHIATKVRGPTAGGSSFRTWLQKWNKSHRTSDMTIGHNLANGSSLREQSS